jgi:hypothetical protein
MHILKWRDPGRSRPGGSRQSGQSSVEYTIVVFFAVLVLIVPDENGNVAIVQVANALKHFYTGFAYAVSLSNTITPL